MSAADSQQPSLLKRLANALLRIPQDRDQLLTILRQATLKKTIDPDALGMIEGVLQVAAMQVRDIMIPRAQMSAVQHDATLKQFLPTIIAAKHSRFPVLGKNRDEVVGILLAKDLLNYTLGEEKFDICHLLRPAIFIPESKRLNVLLREFRANRNHMAIVVDEYGGVAGLVTIEDVLEQIVGEIEDEHEAEEKESFIKKINSTQYNVKATTPIQDFNTYFATRFSDTEFDTIGGLILQRFGHLPRRGESVNLKKFTFKVLHADNRRIRLLRVTQPRAKVKIKVKTKA